MNACNATVTVPRVQQREVQPRFSNTRPHGPPAGPHMPIARQSASSLLSSQVIRSKFTMRNCQRLTTGPGRCNLLSYNPNYKHKTISKGPAPKQGPSPANLQGPAGAPPGGTGQGPGFLLAFYMEKQAPESQGPWSHPLGTHHAWPGHKTGNLK